MLAATLIAAPAFAEKPRSAIFLHPDGMGANTWAAVRLQQAGPDGRLAWDQLPRLAIYVGPMLDSVNASSNGGATTHAYGIRAALDSFGSLDGVNPPVSASGKKLSVMHEAQKAGKAIAIVNSSTITEPGTAAFLVSVEDRDNDDEIAALLLAAKPDIMLGGGEQFFLPEGTQGVHGPGVRTDGRNLVEEAREAGYSVVHTREELAALPTSTLRVLGLFAAEHTFNEYDEATLAEKGLPAFQPQAPRFDEMVAAALARLRGAPKGYLLVGNEEGTDNLSGENNAPAVLEAAAGADRAIALALAEARRNPALTVLVASDSDNGGMNATGDDLEDPEELPRPLPSRTANGSPLDSDNGQPFLSAPDARGIRQPFYITWASDSDSGGGTVARGIGPGAAVIEGTIDSTAIYTALYLGLFGKRP
jgi:alkaline phosphatase